MTTVPHVCATHNRYRLTCDDFTALQKAAAGQCQRCSALTSQLVIDHDHAGGMAAVRGLLCPPCNSRLGRVDGLRIPRDDLDDAYLSRVWHKRRRIEYVPDSNTKVRALRVDEGLWEAAQAKAVERRENVSVAVRRFLLAYVDDDAPPTK